MLIEFQGMSPLEGISHFAHTPVDEAHTDPSSYRPDILVMLNRGLRRLTVSLDEIRAHNQELADGYVLRTPCSTPT
jgi:hypothetical protein